MRIALGLVLVLLDFSESVVNNSKKDPKGNKLPNVDKPGKPT